jgi:hypothetical protein
VSRGFKRPPSALAPTPTVDEAIEAAARCEGTPMRWARCLVVLAREIIRLRAAARIDYTRTGPCARETQLR